MYAEKVLNIDTLAPDLLAASEQYQLSALKNLCEKTLIKIPVLSLFSNWLLVTMLRTFKQKFRSIDLHLIAAKVAQAMLSTQ